MRASCRFIANVLAPCISALALFLLLLLPLSTVVYNVWGEFSQFVIPPDPGRILSMRPKSPWGHILRNTNGFLCLRFYCVALFVFTLPARLDLSSPASDHLQAEQHASRGYELAQKGDLREAENELRRSVMTPRWGLERQEGRRLSTKIPPLRGSMRFKRHRTAFQGNNPQICRTPGAQLDIKGL